MTTGGEIHIHTLRPVAKKLTRANCPDCRHRAVIANYFTPWYGWESTCLRCGRSWRDGEWMPLYWEPQSRPKAIAAAKKRWRTAVLNGWEESYV